MNGCIITIGDELLIGQVVNTNAAYLSRKLNELGVTIGRIITVPDKRKEILSEFSPAFKNYDAVVVTGGLGPTHDDITKDCISKFFNSKLILNKRLLASIKKMFERRHIPFAKNNISQGMLPDIAKALPNKQGTAPGILIEKSGKIFCAVPGVPGEMEFIVENSLLPFLQKKLKKASKKQIIKSKTLHTIGIAESLLFQKLGKMSYYEVKEKSGIVRLAFLPANFEVRIRITAISDNDKKAEKLLQSTILKLRHKAGNYIYSYDESPIEKVVGNLLLKNKLKLSAAESCTGGLVASKITDVSGSSKYFFDGIVAYTNKAKKKFLGVNQKTLKANGAVSEQVAMEMADGARKFSNSDIGISTTGIAGPTGATKDKPVGLVWIGYSDRKITFAKDYYFTRDRLRNKEMMSKMALELLRRQLLKL